MYCIVLCKVVCVSIYFIQINFFFLSLLQDPFLETRNQGAGETEKPELLHGLRRRFEQKELRSWLPFLNRGPTDWTGLN